MRPKLVPELICSNLDESLDFYLGLLEFRILYARPETSMMMAAFGDCVRSDKLGEAFGPIGPAAEALLVWKSFKDLTSSGVRGDARRATAEKGEKLFDIAVGLQLIAGAPWD